MPGYLAKSATNTAGMTYDALLYCKTNIGGYFFDGFINVDINSELSISSNPVESGASVSDHAYINPARIDMTIKMSDVHQSFVSGQFEGGWSRSVTAYEILRELQRNRVPVSVLTRLELFENMLISSIVANDNSDTYQSLDAKVSLVELPVARVKTVKISEVPQTTGGTNLGTVNATNASEGEYQSALYQLGGYFGLWG